MKRLLNGGVSRLVTKLLFVVAFFSIGIALLLATRAATPTAHFEAEDGTSTAPVQKQTDVTASAGGYLQFGPGAVAPSAPSGQAMPIGNLPGWRQIFAEDFTKDAATGTWGRTCSQDPNGQSIVYTGATGTQWRSYPQCYQDTYQKRPYRADQVLSVHDGVLDFYLHKVDGIPAGANPSPVIKNGSQYQTYGRYAARFRVVNAAALSDYYVAWLTWPQSENWNANGPGDGEIDFPEGHLNGTVGGFHHCLYNNSVNCGVANTNGATFSSWHTYVVEWTPQYVRFILDGQTVMNYTDPANIPDTPMRWQLQTETNGPGTNNGSGHLELDWVTVYERI